MFKIALKNTLRRAGLRVIRQESLYPTEMSESDKIFVRSLRNNGLSMVSDEGLVATTLACQHVAQQKIAGDFVECGVWRGGCSMIAARIFKQHKLDKSIYLFDTFAGMTEPSADDVDLEGVAAKGVFEAQQRDDHNDWCYASLNDVTENFEQAGLLSERVHFVKGDVLKTLYSTTLPEQIAVLRLDTDWYESTKLELELLYPRLVPGGMLILDDYGHWGGARKAVDEYFSNKFRPFFATIDQSGRIAVKPG